MLRIVVHIGEVSFGETVEDFRMMQFDEVWA